MSQIPPSPNTPSQRPDNSANKKRIGEILIDAGVISREDLAQALDSAKTSGEKIGYHLIRSKKITVEQLGKALGVRFNLRYVNLMKTEPDKSLLALLPEEFMREHKLLPVGKERGRLVIAMTDPTNRVAVDEITFLTGIRPMVVVTTELEFREFCSKNLGDFSSSKTLIDEIALTSDEGSSEAEELARQREAEMSDTANPLVKLVNSIIEEAIDREASDIHIEPRSRKYLVRFRVDGILRTILEVPNNMESTFVTRVKVMSRMDIAEHRRPQDGRISIRHKNMDYNLRVNTLPVSDNREKIVIRILRPSKSISSYESLGFSTDEIEKLDQIIRAPYGIILVCGPTGSGKTTTLYTILNKINTDDRNISTVEDPVELTIEGLNQSQVNPKADYTFATSMRALLRQDPDVIMVGEIRDYETLEASVHAALTGHLVFSTIHSNNTATTITRMIEMGAASNLIGSALVAVLAQRLVRAICPYCKVDYEASVKEKAILYPHDEQKQAKPMLLSKGTGCEICAQTGYSGRTGVFELMLIDREIRQMINDAHSDLEIEDSAVASGMRTLQTNGRHKVLNGTTTLEEVVRVLGLHVSGQ
ncbi:MAG: GspE/PulE family protein [Candidatus Melainabacteria bacterium]